MNTDTMEMNMNELPERAWLVETWVGEQIWGRENIPGVTQEYVRGDLYEALEARVSELEAKNRWLMNDAEEVQRAIDTTWRDSYRRDCNRLTQRVMEAEAEIDRLREALREIAAVKHPSEPPNPYKQMARAALGKDKE